MPAAVTACSVKEKSNSTRTSTRHAVESGNPSAGAHIGSAPAYCAGYVSARSMLRTPPRLSPARKTKSGFRASSVTRAVRRYALTPSIPEVP